MCFLWGNFWTTKTDNSSEKKNNEKGFPLNANSLRTFPCRIHNEKSTSGSGQINRNQIEFNIFRLILEEEKIIVSWRLHPLRPPLWHHRQSVRIVPSRPGCSRMVLVSVYQSGFYSYLICREIEKYFRIVFVDKSKKIKTKTFLQEKLEKIRKLLLYAL